MSVLLPAPFSPSSALISPGWTTRSMWSLATRSPKRLVMPRSSSFTAALPCRAGRRSGQLPADQTAGRTHRSNAQRPLLHRALGGRLDRAVVDARLQGPQLCLQGGRNLGVPWRVERREYRAAVCQGADVSPAVEV